MSKKVAIILINYKEYANRFLPDCIVSLRAQDYVGETEIFIVDNASSDESYNFLKATAPEAQIICNKNNDGFAKGNNDAINLALALNFEYIILFNMDTIVAPNAVSEMAKAAESSERIGSVQARLMLHPETTKVNSLGNSTHFLGFGYCEGYNDIYKEGDDSLKEIFYPSGAAVLFKAATLRAVGVFDESLWMYNEDQDLGWRIWLKNYTCVMAPRAVVYHKYEFGRSISKYYWMDRNRMIVMLKNYSCLTLILIFPALLVMEIGLFIFSLQNGWFKEKLKVWGYFLNLKNWQRIIRERRKIQRNRKLKESEILKMISAKIWYQEVGSNKLRVANIFFSVYWNVVRFILKIARA
ncbi:MAG: glycosyltransferase family 2 protein [Candidatus Falkowbacteria bacterium]